MATSRRIPKVFVVFGGFGVAVLALAGIGYSLTDIPQAAGSFKENEAKARAAGLVMSADEYRKRLAFPADQNGGPLLAEVIKEFATKYEKEKFFVGSPSSQQMDTKLVTRVYGEFEPFWQKLEAAAAKPQAIVPKDRRDLMSIRFEEFSSLRGIAKLCSYRAEIALNDNEPDVARQAWVRAAKASLMCDDEPILIGTLVRIACSAITTESIRKALNTRGTDARWRAAAWNALTVLDQPIDMAKSIQFEHGFAVDGLNKGFRDPGSILLTENRWEKMKTTFGARLPGMKAATFSRLHEGYAQYVDDLGKDPFDVAALLRAGTNLDRFASREGASYVFVSLVLPVFSQAGQAVAKEYANRNTLMQAVKLLETPGLKELPLKGRYALDCDGKPLRIVLQKGGLVVYSLGPNLADDGGQIEKKVNGTSTRDYDFGVRIPR